MASAGGRNRAKQLHLLHGFDCSGSTGSSSHGSGAKPDPDGVGVLHCTPVGAAIRSPEVHPVCDEALPQPWEPEANAVNPAPKAFAVQPPRGRRHVLAQLEKKPKETTSVDGGEEEEDQEEQPTPHGTYVFSVFGNIYPFRALFDERGVAGCQLQVGSPGEHKKEYIRFVEFEEQGDHEGLINMVLVECLNRIPVYFINMAGKKDKVAQWILQQPSVYPGE